MIEEEDPNSFLTINLKPYKPQRNKLHITTQEEFGFNMVYLVCPLLVLKPFEQKSPILKMAEKGAPLQISRVVTVGLR